MVFIFFCGFARSKDNNPNYLSFKVEGAAAYYCYYFKFKKKKQKHFLQLEYHVYQADVDSSLGLLKVLSRY